MSSKKIELKVGIYCQKCKTGVLKVVAKLAGVEEVQVNAEKGTLTVIGTVDPICIATRLRKAGFFAEITSVGPPKKPDPPVDPPKPIPPCCQQCQLVGIRYTYDNGGCSIL